MRTIATITGLIFAFMLMAYALTSKRYAAIEAEAQAKDSKAHRLLLNRIERLEHRVSRVELLLPDEVFFGRERSLTEDAINMKEFQQ